MKYNITLANNVGIVDADYYKNKTNGGEIMAKLVNNSDRAFVLRRGDRFMQGVFLHYDTTKQDDAKDVRTGGIGSTGRD